MYETFMGLLGMVAASLMIGLATRTLSDKLENKNKNENDKTK